MFRAQAEKLSRASAIRGNIENRSNVFPSGCTVGQGFEDTLDDPARKGFGQGKNSGSVQPRQPRFVDLQQMKCRRGGLTIQRRVVGARQIGKAGESGADRRVEVLFEVGQQLEAHAIARIREIRIRGILTPLLTSGDQLGSQLAARAREQRPNDTRAGRSDGPETSYAAAADQAQQHGFGLVVQRMSRRHDVGVMIAPYRIEEGAACLTTRDFDRLSAQTRERGNVDMLADETTIESSRQLSTERFVLICITTADTVVHMGNGIEYEIAAKVELVEQNEQRDRIRAARDCGDHTSLRPPKVVSSRET
jgi:hypothetical protein